MHKVGAGTGGPDAQIKFLKQEIKQTCFRSKFEIKIWNEIKLKLIFQWNEFEINLKFSFKLIFKFKLNMKVKFIFEMRIVYNNSLAFKRHHRRGLYSNLKTNILTFPSGVPAANTKLSSGEVIFIALLGREKTR